MSRITSLPKIYNIPLPHLGYGYTPDGSGGWNTVQLTVNNVTEGYDEGGSLKLIEDGFVERASNFLLWSEEFNNHLWPHVRVQIINNQTSPTGSNDASILKYIDDSTTGGYLDQVYTVDSIEVFTFSIFAKKGSFDIINIANAHTKKGRSFNLTTGESGVFLADPINYSIVSITDDWYRIGITVQTQIGGNSFRIFIEEADGAILNDTLIVWGAQLDKVNQVGEYIKTEATIKEGGIIPNTPAKTPAYPIIDGDTFVAGTDFLNTSNFQLRLFTIGDTDPEYTFFDKRNVLIWKDTVRARDYFNVGDPGNFHSSELTQAQIYEDLQDDYKYMWWIRIINNQFENIYLYGTARTEAAICLNKNYVQLGEDYETADATHYVCSIDKAI